METYYYMERSWYITFAHFVLVAGDLWGTIIGLLLNATNLNLPIQMLLINIPFIGFSIAAIIFVWI